MSIHFRKIAVLVSIFVFSLFSWASESGTEPSHAEEKGGFNLQEFIQHHLKDTHYVEFFGTETQKFGFPLPVMLWDNGPKIFSSSKLYCESDQTTLGENTYKLYHGKIYKTDAAGTINYDEKHHPTNVKPFDFSITKNVLYVLITGLLMLFMFGRMAKGYAKNELKPTGLGRFLEPIVLYVKDEIAIPNIGEKHYKRFLPFLLTIFFFIWILNLLGISPLGVNATGNITITVALALLVFLITTFSGNKTYWLHILDPLGDSMPWIAKIPIYIILVPIEIAGIFIKPFSLFIRLFANMTAGHVVIMSLIGMIFAFTHSDVMMQNVVGAPLTFILSFVIMIIEFFVAALQAYIFTMLAAMYFGMATVEHHAEEH